MKPDQVKTKLHLVSSKKSLGVYVQTHFGRTEGEADGGPVLGPGMDTVRTRDRDRRDTGQ